MKNSKRIAVCSLGLAMLGAYGVAGAFSFSFSPGPSQNNTRPWGQVKPPKQNAIMRTDPAPGAYGNPNHGFGGQWNRQGMARPFSQGAATGQQSAPTLKATLNETSAYVQQTAILSLQVTSSVNLAKADVHIPQVPGIVIKKLEGPIASSEQQGSRHVIVNKYYYALTPLQSGSVEIPALRITGTLADTRYGRGQPFELQSKPARLDVLPPNPTQKPWLPVHRLSLRGELSGAETVEPGQPVNLRIEVSSVGASGAQLPSLQPQLEKGPFRVYLESSETTGSLSEDGKQLVGTRTESFTLVAQQGGKLVLPALQIGWWNVDTGTRELTTLPGKNLAGGGMIPVLDNRTQSFFPAGSSAMFWGPLAAIFSMLALYWGWQWAKGWQLRRHRAGRRLALPIPGLAFVNNALGRVGAKFTDLRIGERVRYRLMRGIPKSLRVWFCVRCANAEEDPAAWCQHVKFMACRHLQMAEQATMPKIGEKIVSLHPRADEARVRALIRKLDSALYGSEELDFASWKRAFKREIRPTLLPRRRTGHDRTGGGLPELNPRKAA